ncbi:hypothetical protein [Streptomyces sp. NPDC057052]|uniref:hypothetical protein n=1 Tax=Streptomyces sp. NPDC057052 TaxID=3346010 RepID=UPI003625CBE2
MLRTCASRPRKGFVILDGALITADRIAGDEPYYSMKHRRQGMNAQVVASLEGTPLWFSRALLGRRHDLSHYFRTERRYWNNERLIQVNPLAGPSMASASDAGGCPLQQVSVYFC